MCKGGLQHRIGTIVSIKLKKNVEYCAKIPTVMSGLQRLWILLYRLLFPGQSPWEWLRIEENRVRESCTRTCVKREMAWVHAIDIPITGWYREGFVRHGGSFRLISRRKQPRNSRAIPTDLETRAKRRMKQRVKPPRAALRICGALSLRSRNFHPKSRYVSHYAGLLLLTKTFKHG